LSTLSNYFKAHVYLVSVIGATPDHTPLKHRCLVKIVIVLGYLYLINSFMMDERGFGKYKHPIVMRDDCSLKT
jgi:hypothetical protein